MKIYEIMVLGQKVNIFRFFGHFFKRNLAREAREKKKGNFLVDIEWETFQNIPFPGPSGTTVLQRMLFAILKNNL